ncbi:hypothetical protein NEFER03_0672 [Nematocida sp. LUAm3]|nr:hypothetical protein NEFER03_0672 [Nematocida sp. LUAm3]KAI5175131.1 hypothetical protein NEFER02_1092 [Nematocida sp. LUAm2]KAI5178197.1 hypothetical protein NEFER01_1375 [Nematocida sp. LUAm1]
MPLQKTEESLEELKRLYKDLSSARTKYDQGMIRTRIREIESFLEETPMRQQIEPNKQRVVIEIENSVKEDHNIYSLSNASHQKISLSKPYESAYISSITGVCLLNLHLNSSCHISNSQDSFIYLITNQVRLTNCKNITIYAYTRTGVYVEKCTNITVLPYELECPPIWMNNLTLYDFNQPKIL